MRNRTKFPGSPVISRPVRFAALDPQHRYWDSQVSIVAAAPCTFVFEDIYIISINIKRDKCDLSVRQNFLRTKCFFLVFFYRPLYPDTSDSSGIIARFTVCQYLKQDNATTWSGGNSQAWSYYISKLGRLLTPSR